MSGLHIVLIVYIYTNLVYEKRERERDIYIYWLAVWNIFCFPIYWE